MLKAGGRMTAKRSQSQRFVVADSTFELEIEDVNDIRGGKEIVTDKIQLMELSDVTWTVKVHEIDVATYFHADLHDIPEELQENLKLELAVTCRGKPFVLAPSQKYVGCLKTCLWIHPSIFAQHLDINSITLNFRLVISCAVVPSLRRKFYDPLAAKKEILEHVANMFGDSTFADFTFIVGSREFQVHMNILAAASPVMRGMFTTNLKEAKTKSCTVEAIDSETFDHMLGFIYNADIPEDLSTVAKPLYEAAHYYRIKILENVCLENIRESLSADNALEVFEWAQPYDLNLKADAWKIIKRDILKIFVELKDEPLPIETIEAIIKQRGQEKKFWEDLEEKIVKKV